MSGVLQFVGSSRCLRHSSLPVVLSSAAMKSSPSWSQFTMSVSPWSAGEAPSPKLLRVCCFPKSFSHFTFPSKSSAWSPREPKKAYSILPSVTGEAEAKP